MMPKVFATVGGIVGVAAAAYIGASWYVGSQAEPQIHQQVASMNQLMTAASLNVVDYQRGWLSSEVDYELVIPENDQHHGAALHFKDKLLHGPLPLRAIAKGHFTPMLAYSQLALQASPDVQAWFDATDGQPPLIASSQVGFTGHNQTHIDFAAIAYHDERGNQLQSQPATATINYQIGTGDDVVDLHINAEHIALEMGGHPTGQATLDWQATQWDYGVLAVLQQSEQIDMISEEELQPLLQQFFSYEPQLRIAALDWKNAGGESHIQANVVMAATAADDPPDEQQATAPSHYFDELDLSIRLSRGMLHELFPEENFASSLIDMLFAQFAEQGHEAGLLHYDGRNATVQLQLDKAKDQLLLNNEPTDLTELFYLLVSLNLILL